MQVKKTVFPKKPLFDFNEWNRYISSQTNKVQRTNVQTQFDEEAINQIEDLMQIEAYEQEQLGAEYSHNYYEMICRK